MENSITEEVKFRPSRGQAWLPDAVEFLTQHYRTRGDIELAANLTAIYEQHPEQPGRVFTRKMVEGKRMHMGLLRTEQELKAIIARYAEQGSWSGNENAAKARNKPRAKKKRIRSLRKYWRDSSRQWRQKYRDLSKLQQQVEKKLFDIRSGRLDELYTSAELAQLERETVHHLNQVKRDIFMLPETAKQP